jgi:hypothetical protein
MLDSIVHAVQPMMPAVSFVGSAASVGVTGYFWFVKMNRERPNLQAEGVEHVSYVDLGQATDDVRWLCFRLGMVVVNESALPNAILNASVHVMPKGSEGWVEVPNVRPMKGSPFPVNLPALQSGSLILEWEMSFPYLTEVEESNDPAGIVEGYLRHNWERPECVAVEIRGVRRKTFTELVSIAGSRMSSSVRYHLEMSQR